MRQITIIGVGLIGGSLGLAVKKKRLAKRVVGVAAHKSTLMKALKRGAIDTGMLEAKKSVAGSDIVILATPVDKILSTLKKITPFLKKGCIVIDVASVKEAIVGPAEKIVGKRACFVGVHPMAGSEQRGIENSDAGLFKGALCIVTKTGRTDAAALRIVANLWKALGSRICVMPPGAHDRNISNISHLPHVAAFALSLISRPLSMKFASTGFKDTTRIASSDPALWVPILIANRKNVGSDIKAYITEISRMRDFILGGNKARLRKVLLRAKEKRDKLSA